MKVAILYLGSLRDSKMHILDKINNLNKSFESHEITNFVSIWKDEYYDENNKDFLNLLAENYEKKNIKIIINDINRDNLKCLNRRNTPVPYYIFCQLKDSILEINKIDNFDFLVKSRNDLEINLKFNLNEANHKSNLVYIPPLYWYPKKFRYISNLFPKNAVNDHFFISSWSFANYITKINSELLEDMNIKSWDSEQFMFKIINSFGKSEKIKRLDIFKYKLKESANFKKMPKLIRPFKFFINLIGDLDGWEASLSELKKKW